jgi:hypothetical protein
MVFRFCQCSWGEDLMEKKCVLCDILLDVPCTHPGCAGHHNDSRGDVCVYCATNEREIWTICACVRASVGPV